MTRRRPRGLRPEEKELWTKVADTAKPLHPERPAPAPKPPFAKAKKPLTPVQRFRLGEAAKSTAAKHDIAPTIAQQVASQPLQMDRKRFGQMKKGRLVPEARIDLHGMTLAQAHPALVDFILTAATDGKRLVLVITGKGKSKPDHGPIPERHGVLRHQVPHWLHSGILKPYVLQTTEAHVKHGGQGAYYVYLRRAR